MLQMAKFLCLFTHSQVKLDDRPPFLFPSVLNPGTLSLGLSTSNTLSFALGQFTNYHNPILKRSENGTSYLHSIKEAHGSSSIFLYLYINSAFGHYQPSSVAKLY